MPSLRGEGGGGAEAHAGERGGSTSTAFRRAPARYLDRHSERRNLPLVVKGSEPTLSRATSSTRTLCSAASDSRIACVTSPAHTDRRVDRSASAGPLGPAPAREPVGVSA